METALYEMMEYRFKLTKIVVPETDQDIDNSDNESSVDSNTSDIENDSSDESDSDENDTFEESDGDEETCENVIKSKYSPPLRWKEHYLRHELSSLNFLAILTRES